MSRLSLLILAALSGGCRGRSEDPDLAPPLPPTSIPRAAVGARGAATLQPTPAPSPERAQPAPSTKTHL